MLRTRQIVIAEWDLYDTGLFLTTLAVWDLYHTALAQHLIQKSQVFDLDDPYGVLFDLWYLALQRATITKHAALYVVSSNSSAGCSVRG